MNQSNGRRSFLATLRKVLAGGVSGQFVQAANTKPATAESGEDYYDKLGVTKIINAAGVYTSLTASIMPPSVQAAVARAAKHPVRLIELQTAAGEHLAKKLRCEAAMVTAGASSALTLGAAGCVMVANQCGVRDIPSNIPGRKDEVIIQKGHRYGYDEGILCAGVKFVEVETLEEYDHAFNSKTVMTHFFNAAGRGTIDRQDWIRVSHAHGVPCFNDASADVPPISNLWKYTQMGFDLVTFSGGKGIRGPQNSGLLMGRKDLIAAASANNNPHDGVGRGQKVAKEQIVGLLAAVDLFLTQTDEGMEAEFRSRAERIAKLVRTVPGVETEIGIPPIANHVPHLLVRCDPAQFKLTGLEVAAEMRKGTPSIELNPWTGQAADISAGFTTGANTIVVGVWMLQPGEDLTVARRLHEVLSKART